MKSEKDTRSSGHGTSSTRNGKAVRRHLSWKQALPRQRDRLISFKIESESTTAHIISCYAPQTRCRDDEKEYFWDSLDTHLWTIAPDEHIILGGDLNGQVGSGNAGYMCWHGGHGLSMWNDDGSRILDCTETHDLLWPTLSSRRGTLTLATYTSAGHATQIDYWIIWQWDLKLVSNTKVNPVW